MLERRPPDADMPSPMLQRSWGNGRIVVSCEGDRTRLKELYQDGCGKIRVPRLGGSGLEAVLINTSGGMTGGDQIKWSATVGPGASLTLTTQACEKVYKSAAGAAQVETNISVGAGGQLNWLPQETILFDHGALDRRLNLELGEGARALIVEPVILGRTGMGERVTHAHLADQWRVRSNGRLVHAEATRLGGAFDELRGAAGLGPLVAYATVVLVGPDVDVWVSRYVERATDKRCAISCWDGKLVMRLWADSGLALRRMLVPILHELSLGQLPRIWMS